MKAMPLSGWLTPESGVLGVLIRFPLAVREYVAHRYRCAQNG
jgi:hypothetical protein